MKTAIYYDRWNRCFREVEPTSNNAFETKQQAIDAYRHEMELHIVRLKGDIIDAAQRLSRTEKELEFAALLTPQSRDALPTIKKL